VDLETKVNGLMAYFGLTEADLEHALIFDNVAGIGLPNLKEG
jgi:hypothetical protein